MNTRSRLIGRVALGGATLLATWVVTTTTIGSVLAKAQPQVATTWSPGNAEANGYLALRLYNEDPLHPRKAAIVQAARRALARSPANVNAVSMLGVQADARGQKVRADRLFEQSDRMSRHDPVTQIYLIEAAVARGNIAGALRHYDAVLSTSRTSAALLIPVLVTASADPAIARPLAELLARRPIWWPDFTRRLVQAKTDPGAGFPLLLRGLRLDPKNSSERQLLSAAIDRLVEAGSGFLAYGLYRQAKSGAPALPVTVRNGSFEDREALPPFDWAIREEDDASGTIQPLGQGKALFVSSSAVNAEVAAQRLLLQPGKYVLGARIGSENHAGGEISLAINCAGVGGEALARLRAPAAGDPKLWQTAFTVPSGCISQRLSILASPAEQSGSQSWIDAVTIARAP